MKQEKIYDDDEVDDYYQQMRYSPEISAVQLIWGGIIVVFALILLILNLNYLSAHR